MTRQITLEGPGTWERAGAVEAFLAMHGSIRAAASIYTDDAVLDLNVPRWRFQLAGPKAITAAFAKSYPEGFTVATSRWEPTPGGAVVEYDGHDVATGDYYRHLALLALNGGHIRRLTLYCTGAWDADTVERQRREAPMVDTAGEAR